MAPAAGEEVPGGIHPNTGDPGHQHPLELQKWGLPSYCPCMGKVTHDMQSALLVALKACPPPHYHDLVTEHDVWLVTLHRLTPLLLLPHSLACIPTHLYQFIFMTVEPEVTSGQNRWCRLPAKWPCRQCGDTAAVRLFWWSVNPWERASQLGTCPSKVFFRGGGGIWHKDSPILPARWCIDQKSCSTIVFGIFYVCFLHVLPFHKA